MMMVAAGGVLGLAAAPAEAPTAADIYIGAPIGIALGNTLGHALTDTEEDGGPEEIGNDSNPSQEGWHENNPVPVPPMRGR